METVIGILLVIFGAVNIFGSSVIPEEQKAVLQMFDFDIEYYLKQVSIICGCIQIIGGLMLII